MTWSQATTALSECHVRHGQEEYHVTDEWPSESLYVETTAQPDWAPVPFHQFILKLHNRCNLACDYCYMYELGDRTWFARPRTMSPAIVRQTCQRITTHVAHHRLRQVHLTIHGGEPLLAGPAAVVDVATQLRRLLPPEIALDVVVQTNGLLLCPEVLDMLLPHGIRVGVSLDGTKDTHERHRRFRTGEGSYDRIARAIRLLGDNRYRHLFAGLLCVVDLDADPVTTYESLVAFDPPRIDFLLPHGNWSQPPPNRSVNSATSPYGDWLVTAFERWYSPLVRETDVRLFSEIINLLLGGQSRTESVGLSPVSLITVDTDGSMEQVDTLRSAYPGAAATGLNVIDHSFDDALQQPSIIARQIGVAALADICRQCPIHRICGGGHYVHRYRRGSGFRNASVYCPDLTRLITHMSSRIYADTHVV
jgi:uncharacterized protein